MEKGWEYWAAKGHHDPSFVDIMITLVRYIGAFLWNSSVKFVYHW